MMFAVFVRALGCAGLVMAAAPSFASEASDAFAANVRLRAAFLAQASELARDHAGSDRVRQFAATQKDEQAGILDELNGPSVTDAPALVAELSEPVTGRSAVTEPAIDLARFEAPSGIGAVMPAAVTSLDQLSSQHGAAFDALYAKVVRGAISDLAALYDAYGKTGDDVAMRSLATRELPRMTADVAALD